MGHLLTRILFVSLLVVSVSPAFAGTVESGGGGFGGSGGAGDASLAEQQTQTGLLGTIDADTGAIAGAVKAEDAAHASGDTGVMSLCVRQDTAAALATTNGDYIPCATDATGRMWTNTELPDAEALADTTANPTVPGVGSYNMCWNGSTWDRCVKATAETTGVQIVRPHALLADRVSGVAGITDGSSTSVVAAQGASTRFCATTIVVSNSSATNVTVDIRDGTAGSVLMTIPAAANMGGGVIALGVPLCGSANTIFAADPSASATTVTISVVGFKTTL